MAAKKPEVKTNTAVATVEEKEKELVIVSDRVPEHLADKTGNRGSENVGSEDLVIPRLEVVQAISEAMDKATGGYIKGAEVGDLINSVTNRNYGKEVYVVPVHYSKQFLVWKSRAQGGGFFGSHSDMIAAKERADAEGGEAAGVEVIDTPTHLCLLVDRDSGSVDEIMISMPRTKAKISRQWNSMVKLAGGDRFARVYKITTQMEKNKKGNFANFVVQVLGFPSKGLFARAEKLYEQIAAGTKNRVMDVSGFNPGAADDDSDM